MSGSVAASELSLSATNVSYVVIALVIALVALGFAAGLVRTVLATGRGTEKMQEISGAVQEGATAYLFRQFKTLAVFVVVAVVLLFLLPVNEGGTAVQVGRSVFFVVGAVFSAFIGREQVMTTLPDRSPARFSTSPNRNQCTPSTTASAPSAASRGVPARALPPASRASASSFRSLRA